MTRLTILHTNDVHGRVGQLSRVAALARHIRREVEAEGGHCLLLDGGDAEDTILLESSVTKGSAVMALLRAAGYDAPFASVEEGVARYVESLARAA